MSVYRGRPEVILYAAQTDANDPSHGRFEIGTRYSGLMPAEGVSATTASPSSGQPRPDVLKPACVASATIHTDYLLVRACADRRATFARLQRSAGRRQHARSQIPKSQRHFRWVWRAIEKANRAEIMFDVLMNILVILSVAFPPYHGFLVRDGGREEFGSVQDLPWASCYVFFQYCFRLHAVPAGRAR